MPSTPSPRLRAELQARGENVNTWGDARLNNALLRLEEGIAKVLPLTVTGNLVLTAQNYSEDEARSAVLLLKGTPPAAFTITIPNTEKTYWVVNDTARVASIATAAGDAAQIRAGFISFVVCDGDDTRVADFPLDKLMPPAGPLSLNGKRIENLGPATADGHAVTRLQLTTLTQPLVDLARDWAQKILGTVDGSEYSAKEYAVGATTPLGSAKAWATSLVAVAGGLKGARGYAQDASGSASTASTAASNASDDALDVAALLADFSNRYVVATSFPTVGNFDGRLSFSTGAQQLGVYKSSLGSFTVLDSPSQATETVLGIVELATLAETQALSDPQRVITPAGLGAVIHAPSRGGTGRSSLSAGSLLAGDGTNPVALVAPGSAGNVLTSTGSIWQSSPVSIPSAAGAVGTYALLRRSGVTATSFGTDVAGSELVPTSASQSESGATQIGTWRCLGALGASSSNRTAIFLRIA